ncbi:hypothetical protein PIB30_030259 [Stylosanthes scabra]|uniref:Uncharacterized protein n=1 Tax=Stylosanthes scabra TaxID=79078 RepID=A0ABU6YDV9_9FABA|nr:hypothetical protein [Stylosanthes scabra]
MSRRFSQIVVSVYQNGVPREGLDDVEFHSPNLVVCMMWPVETLNDLQKIVMRNMRLPERTPSSEWQTEFDREDLGDSDGSSSGSGDNEFVGTTPVGTRFLLPAPLSVFDFSTVDSHFHTLDLVAMEEDRMTDIGAAEIIIILMGGRVMGRTKFCS